MAFVIKLFIFYNKFVKKFKEKIKNVNKIFTYDQFELLEHRIFEL
jgi:hypothetical protein